MEADNFEIKYANLIKEMEIRMDKPEENRAIIPDGVMISNLYFKNNIRLAWFLKEPYDEPDGTGGGWSYFDMFKKKNLYLEEFKKNHKTTWHPIIYISYSIFNNFPKWSDMDYIRESHEMCEIVKQVAFINSQKLPSKSVTKSYFNELNESIKLYSDLLIRQIDLLNPNVLIFGNTFNIFSKIININESDLVTFNSIKYVIKKGNLYISAYHPAQRQVKRENYINDIITIVENWEKELL